MIRSFSNFLIIVILTITSCNYSTYSMVESTNEILESSLIHKYAGESSANEKSDFALKNRKIEFEYIKNKIDSSTQVIVRITSGYNEGELLNKMQIISKGNQKEKISTDSIISRDYIEEYSYTISTPITKQKTINDPGGVDVVVQADGTHKHVHRAPSTKIVNVTENQTNKHSGAKSQIFNEMKIYFEKNKTVRLKDVIGYVLFFQNCQIRIELDIGQINELNNYL